MDKLADMKSTMSASDLKKLKDLEKDPIMSQLLNKLIESQVESALKASKEKKICPSAVIVGKKKAMEILQSELEEDKVELFIANIGPDGKEQIYTQCTRPTYEKEKYCWKHCQVYAKNPDNVIPFEKVKEDVKGREANLADEIFTVTASKQSKETLNFIRSEALVNIFAKAIGHDGEVNINIKKVDNKAKPAAADDDEEADAEDEDVEGEAEEEVEDDDDDDEAQCEEIKTSDGRKLYLEKASGTVYSPEGDDQGKELGILMTVSDKTKLEIDGENKIVAKEIKYNKKDYFRCALSDMLYQMVNDQLIAVGKVALQKNGEYKVSLNPTKKEEPAAKKEPATKKEPVTKDAAKPAETKKSATTTTTKKTSK